MLFVPCRNEDIDLINVDDETKFESMVSRTRMDNKLKMLLRIMQK